MSTAIRSVVVATLLVVFLFASQATAAPPDVDAILKARGELIFADNFDRAEADDAKEQLGKSWQTNSKRRAKGVKQADLKDGHMTMTMAAVADHGVSVKHDAPFDDGVVRVRFRIHDAKGIGFNFNDPACKVSHAGHICHVGVRPKKVDLRDGKTGVFDLEIRKKRLAGAPKAEINRLTKGTIKYIDAEVAKNTWHQMTILIQGDTLSAWVNDQFVGQLSSPGIDHAVKQNLAFAVSGVADVDDLKVWKLK